MGVRIVVRAAQGQPLESEVGYAFEQTRVLVGRGAGSDVRIPHPTVSERHAVLWPQDAGYAIEDLASTNGTRVNGARLTPERRRMLKDGDRIEVGVYELSFHTGVLVTETMTAERTAELARRLFRGSARGAALAQPRLVVVAGADPGRSVTIPAPPVRLRIGSAPHCQFVLGDAGVEAEHLELSRDLDGTLVRPLHEVDGAEHRLRDGDELQVGACRLLFEEPADERLKALNDEPDARLPSLPPPAPAPVTEAVAEPAKTAPVRHDTSRGASLDADLIIYALAAIVMAVSLAGLFVLFNQ